MGTRKKVRWVSVGLLFCVLLASDRAWASGVSDAPAAPASASSAAAAKAEIRGMVRQFVRAWNHNDAQMLAGLFAADGSFESPTGAGARGREQIKSLLTEEHRQMFRGTTLSTDIGHIHLHAETAAAEASGTYTLQGVDVALWVEVAVEGTFTFQFTRDSGQWLIATARISKD